MDDHRVNPDGPLPPDSRFLVELARFLDGRGDPSQNVQPPGNAPLDPVAVLEREAELRRIVG